MRPACLARWLIALAAVALAGCGVDQAKDVSLYRAITALDRPAPQLAPGEPLSLEHAVRLANEANERLAIEGENYLQALIERQRAAAEFLPTLDLASAFGFREHVGGDGSSDSTQFDASVAADYTLFNGFRSANRAQAAAATIEQRRALLLDLRESLLLDTAQVYYRVLNAERLAEVLRNSLAVQEERVRDARARQEAGLARPLDVFQSEAQASQTRVQLLDAASDARTGRAALALLTGAPAEASPLSDGFEPPGTLPAAPDLLDLALRCRRDLAGAEAAARAARSEVDVAIGQYLPTVTVNLEYFLARDASPSDLDWAGLLELNLPIFSGGRIEADVREAWSRFRQTVLAYSLTRRQIQNDVAVAYETLALSRERTDELRRQVRAAEEALRQAEASYAAGLGTNLERIAAQDQLLTAQLQLATEEYNHKVSYLATLRAAGVLTEGLTGFRVPPATAPADPPASPFLGLPGRPAEWAEPAATPAN